MSDPGPVLESPAVAAYLALHRRYQALGERMSEADRDRWLADLDAAWWHMIPQERVRVEELCPRHR